MFVFEALFLTFMTTPVVMLLYPPEVRTRVTSTGPDYGAVTEGTAKDANQTESGTAKPRLSDDSDGEAWKSHFTVVLDKIEHLPGMMTITQLINPYQVEDARDASAS